MNYSNSQRAGVILYLTALLFGGYVELFIKNHAKNLGLPEGVTPHTMRHCFACHALEDGVSHTFIQQLLGHRSPNSTDVYLQMTSKALMGIQSPFDTYKVREQEDNCNGE